MSNKAFLIVTSETCYRNGGTRNDVKLIKNPRVLCKEIFDFLNNINYNEGPKYTCACDDIHYDLTAGSNFNLNVKTLMTAQNKNDNSDSDSDSEIDEQKLHVENYIHRIRNKWYYCKTCEGTIYYDNLCISAMIIDAYNYDINESLWIRSQENNETCSMTIKTIDLNTDDDTIGSIIGHQC